MATANATLTTSYTKIGVSTAWSLVSFASASKVQGSPQGAEDVLIELAVVAPAGDAPVATIVGHILRPGESLTPAQIGAGDLWGRVSVFTAATGRTQVVVVS